MSSGGRKRTFGATIRTLNDITNSPNSNAEQPNNKAAAVTASAPTIANGLQLNNRPASELSGTTTIQHIPTLPRANEASSILHRIHSEFAQIIQKRNYNVLSITEMCCCSDGLDHNNKNHGKPQRRNGKKSKRMPNNVLGYNLTHYTKPSTHRIHLRLRHPHTHELMEYESIAGTMCHELAHCVVGPHNAQFYKVMQEIEDQYALFLVRGVVLDRQGFPVASDDAHRLGGRRRVEDRRRALWEATEKRRGLSSSSSNGDYVLGGGEKLRDPKEAARLAAERRLRDSQFCLPCDEVIELLGESDEEDDVKISVASIFGGDRKKRAKYAGINSDPNQVIDLTEDEPGQAVMQPRLPSILPTPNRMQWACVCCTLINQPAALICEACKAPPNSSSGSSDSSAASQGTASLAAAAKSSQIKSTYNIAAKDIKWRCPRCTFDNSCIALVCGACCLER